MMTLNWPVQQRLGMTSSARSYNFSPTYGTYIRCLHSAWVGTQYFDRSIRGSFSLLLQKGSNDLLHRVRFWVKTTASGHGVVVHVYCRLCYFQSLVIALVWPTNNAIAHVKPG